MAGEAGFEPATFSFACNFRSIAWRKVSITRVERSVFSQFLAVAFTIWLLPRLVGEAGFEPALMLVTPGRLRNAKFKSAAPKAFGTAKVVREWREVAAFAARLSCDACDFPPFAYLKSDDETRHVTSAFNPLEKLTTRVVGSILCQRRIRTGYILFMRQMLYLMS